MVKQDQLLGTAYRGACVPKSGEKRHSTEVDRATRNCRNCRKHILLNRFFAIQV